jgi:hypothetical protein
MAKRQENSELESQRWEFTNYLLNEAVRQIKIVTTKLDVLQTNVKKTKNDLDCYVRLWCSRLAVIMGIFGGISLLIGQYFSNGLILCASAIALMSLALGYKQIDIFCKAVRMRFRK